MSHEGSDKELTTALERLSNKITGHDNQENNFVFLKPKFLDAIDFVRQIKKRPDVESIFYHIAKTGFLDTDKSSKERAIYELNN